MVASSSLLSRTSPLSFFDHTYSKSTLSFTMPLSSKGTETEAAVMPISFHDSSHNEQLVRSTSNSCIPDNMEDTRCNEDNSESDMLCDIDLDDLDLSLSDFAMDTESNACSSFQEFVDTALSLSSSPDSHAARLGHQNTVFLTSHFTSDRVTSSTYSSTAASRLGNAPGLEPSSPNSQCHTSIPTKSSSCLELKSHECTAPCLYSSCRRKDETTLSTSTSVKKLKPGDYLPPLYIDTQSYGVAKDTGILPLIPSDGRSKCFLLDPVEHEMQQVDNIPASISATSQTICTDSSCLLTPLSLTDFALGDNEKLSERSEQTQIQRSRLYPAESSNDQLDDSVEDFDIESISDLEKYLTEAELDLRTLTTSLSEHSQPSTYASDSSGYILQSELITQTESGQNSFSIKPTDISSVPKLKLSILDNFSSKDELTSWLDGCEFNMAATPPISPCLTPDWQKSTYSESQNKSGQFSKQDTNILDLFSDDNAHAFLYDDSAIHQMSVSQFL